jgi:hypothetical protein
MEQLHLPHLQWSDNCKPHQVQGVRILACRLPSKSPWRIPLSPSGCMGNESSSNQTGCSVRRS